MNALICHVCLGHGTDSAHGIAASNSIQTQNSPLPHHFMRHGSSPGKVFTRLLLSVTVCSLKELTHIMSTLHHLYMVHQAQQSLCVVAQHLLDEAASSRCVTNSLAQLMWPGRQWHHNSITA